MPIIQTYSQLDPAVTVVMLALGLLLGFVGVGGAGFVSALLIIVFHVPVHLSFATALGSMFVSTASGGWSHLREGNVDPAVGVPIGLAGVLGAYLGAQWALATNTTQLKLSAGLVLIISAGVIFLRTRVLSASKPAERRGSFAESWRQEVPSSAAIGLVCGVGSGLLGIGTAPWIQTGLLVLKGMDLRKAIGTTMAAISLMAFTGAARLAEGGQLSFWLLVSVILGLSTGAFLGAKLTKRAPHWLVRWSMIATPLLAGALLLMAPA